MTAILMVVMAHVSFGLTDPSFETGDAAWSYNLHATRSQKVSPHSGDYVALLSSDATNGGFIGQQFSTAVGSTYEVSCYVSHVDGDAPIVLYAFDPDGDNAYVLATVSQASCPDYQRLSGTFTATTTTSGIVVLVGAEATGAWAIDDCDVTASLPK